MKQQRRQAVARRVMIEQVRQKWLEKPVLFTIPQGIGYGLVYLISDAGDVIVTHADFQETGLPPAFAFNVGRIDEFLTLVLWGVAWVCLGKRVLGVGGKVMIGGYSLYFWLFQR
jgi:hypothetical protein